MTTSALQNLSSMKELQATGRKKHRLGRIVLAIFNGILFIYSSWRSFDLLSGTVPEGMGILAIIGLFGLDIGAVMWFYLIETDTDSREQDWVAWGMFIIDVVGMMLTGITDALSYGDKGGAIYTTLAPITTIALPVIIFLNVLAGFVYEAASAESARRKDERKAEAEEAALEAELDARIRRNDTLLAHARASLIQRQKEIVQTRLMAEIDIELDRIERKTNDKLVNSSRIGAAMNDLGLQMPQGYGQSQGQSSETSNKLAYLLAQLNALEGSDDGGSIENAVPDQKPSSGFFQRLNPFRKDEAPQSEASASQPQSELEAFRPITEEDAVVHLPGYGGNTRVALCGVEFPKEWTYIIPDATCPTCKAKARAGADTANPSEPQDGDSPVNPTIAPA